MRPKRLRTLWVVASLAGLAVLGFTGFTNSSLAQSYGTTTTTASTTTSTTSTTSTTTPSSTTSTTAPSSTTTTTAANTTTTTAGANGNPAVGPGCNNQSVTQGSQITICFVNLPPNTDFSATVQSTPVALPTQHSDAAGNMSVTFSTAGLELGAHTLTISGGGVTVVASFNVVGAAVNGAPLPRTGSNSTIPLFQFSLLSLAVGGVLVLSVRRRRQLNSAHS